MDVTFRIERIVKIFATVKFSRVKIVPGQNIGQEKTIEHFFRFSSDNVVKDNKFNTICHGQSSFHHKMFFLSLRPMGDETLNYSRSCPSSRKLLVFL